MSIFDGSIKSVLSSKEISHVYYQNSTAMVYAVGQFKGIVSQPLAQIILNLNSDTAVDWTEVSDSDIGALQFNKLVRQGSWLVAIGNSSAVRESVDGINWLPPMGLAYTNSWGDLLSAAGNNFYLMAVGENGAIALRNLSTDSDGNSFYNWQLLAANNSLTDGAFRAVANPPGTNEFLVVGDRGAIFKFQNLDISYRAMTMVQDDPNGAIDPITKKIKKVNFTTDNIIDASHNGSYYLVITASQDGSEYSIYRSATGEASSWVRVYPASPSVSNEEMLTSLSWNSALGYWLVTKGGGDENRGGLLTSADGITWVDSSAIVGGSTEIVDTRYQNQLSFGDYAIYLFGPNKITLLGVTELPTYPEISVSQNLLVLPITLLGNTSQRTLTINNTGTANLVISSVDIRGTNSSEFSFSGCLGNVLAGESCTGTVTFAPITVGEKIAELLINHNAAILPEYVILRGEVGQAAISIAVQEILFGETLVNSTATQNISITNIGTAPLIISELTVTGVNATEFLASGCTSAVAPNSTCTVNITFSPTTVGSKNATLQISHNATDSPSIIELVGVGTAAAITLDTVDLNIEPTRIGSSNTGNVTITNTGTAPLHVSDLIITGPSASEFSASGCSSAIGPNAMCTLTVTFSPVEVGSKNATLSIAHNAEGSPSVVGLSSSALAVATSISTDPGVLIISGVEVGTSGTGYITVTNTGSAPLTIANLSIVGTNSNEFSASGCSNEVAPGADCTLTVTFTPTSATAGQPKDATLLIVYNALNTADSPHVIILNGYSTAADISLSTNDLIFDSTEVGTSSTKIISVTNTGTAPLTISNLSITGENAADFSISGCSNTVAAGEACALMIVFSPLGVGSMAAAVVITHSALNSPSTINITGSGILGNTVLLMNMNGADASTNFIDSSNYARSITTSGGAALSSAAFVFGNTSGRFGGPLTVSSSTDLSLPGDFTIEFWLKLIDTSINSYLILGTTGYGDQATTGYTIQKLYSSYLIRFKFWTDSSASQYIDVPEPTTEWHHWAMVKTGSTGKVYRDGTIMGEITGVNNLPESAVSLKIGSTPGANSYYLDDLRIVKNQAIYSYSFDRPTQALTTTVGMPVPITNVVFLMHADGTNGSTEFIDSTGLNTITPYNGAKISTVKSKFGGSSAYFSENIGYGAGGLSRRGYLIVPPSTKFEFGAGDFTIEFWCYMTAAWLNTGGSSYPLVSIGDPFSSPGITILKRRYDVSDSNKIEFYASSTFNSTYAAVQSKSQLPADTWTHIAAVRFNNSIKLFINGVDQGVSIGSNPQTISVGSCIWTDGTPNIGSYDYLDDVRITKGVAVYTTDFLPTTAELTTTLGTPVPAPPVKLLLNMNSTNGSTTFTDSSEYARSVTVGGSAQLSTAVKKYGTASAYFNGNGDYLNIFSNSGDFNFGTENFTIEFWYRPDGGSAYYPSIISSTHWGVNGSTGQAGGFDIRYGLPSPSSTYGGVNYNQKFTVHWYGNSDPFISSSSTFATGEWHHVAVTRNGTVCTLWVNGISQGTNTTSAKLDLPFIDYMGGIKIGGGNWNGDNSYTRGHIDDLRIIKGQAIYTADFTPPASELTTTI